MPTSRPRVLDAFCCAGGAGVGYYMSGCEVTGVDIAPRPNYPLEFVQGDAVEFIREHGHRFDFIHASPPCQHETALTKGTNKGREYPNLIPPTLAALEATGRPYVVENVAGSQLRKDVVLCGEMFKLDVLRHREFQTGGGYDPRRLVHRKHRGRVRGWRHGEFFDGPYVAAYGAGGGKATVDEMAWGMGIHWTREREELTEAIPPAFTEYLGFELIGGRDLGRPTADVIEFGRFVDSSEVPERTMLDTQASLLA